MPHVLSRAAALTAVLLASLTTPAAATASTQGMSPVPPQAAATPLVLLTGDRKSYLLSATSRDVWTWPSRPEPKATVPAGWYCSYSVVHHVLRLSRRCAVQQMMTLRYQVAGLSLHGTAAPGRQSVAITAV